MRLVAMLIAHPVAMSHAGNVAVNPVENLVPKIAAITKTAATKNNPYFLPEREDKL
jgi:hypothetical protein